VFLQNYQALAIFRIYRINFLKKGVNRVYMAMNQVHGLGSHGPSVSLNWDRWLLDGWLWSDPMKGYAASNFGCWSQSERFEAAGGGRRRRCPSSRWCGLRLTGASRYRRSGPLNTIRCSPMASGRRGELVLLTLGRQQAAVAAGDGGGSAQAWRRCRQALVLLWGTWRR
jgi:hypothetical protein